MTSSARKTLLASLILLAWAASMAAAYWWYQARYLRNFSEQTTLFYGEQLQLPEELAGPGKIRLVHFWDPACPCNVGNQQHLSQLIQRFAEQGVDFYVLQKPGSHGQLPDELSSLKPLARLKGSEQIPASPAVAIWDKDGKLAYFGPYSEGATCTSSNSFIEPVLETLTTGRTVVASNTLASGCFCDWLTTP
ncbi:DUF6436 domain-containing protein [Pseudomonas sp. 5P_3.1_Bac2]|uniref:DUF6436 domain-containing protein n=1 Tax=Pseudomonas sp. 5P_3.1_Bac2 TaxID=2971617 RepID=UPI0021C629DD|nr:DUF6436 domain-containing protein [Pseudomonas sp. 5P_3.1_Bac2]MCU1718044.1 DUF6436 domain-containing protein [Pseudomonas sp. 5P_3.1_Bac2]